MAAGYDPDGLSGSANRAILPAVRLKFVAIAALSAALALVAAPGIVGSRTPSPVGAIEAAAFQPLQSGASDATTPVAVSSDPALRSANALDASARFAEPLSGVLAIPLVRAAVRSQPVPGLSRYARDKSRMPLSPLFQSARHFRTCAFVVPGSRPMNVKGKLLPTLLCCGGK